MRRLFLGVGCALLFVSVFAGLGVFVAVTSPRRAQAETFRSPGSVSLSQLYYGGSLGGALLPAALSVEQYGLKPIHYDRCLAGLVGLTTLQCFTAATQNISTGTATSSIQTLNGTITHTIKGATLASNPADAGYTGVASLQTSVDVLPTIYFRYLQDATITNMRMFMGLATGGQNVNVAAMPTVSQAQAGGIVYMGLRWNTGIYSGDWACCSSNGTNESCTDTGVAYAASHTYLASVAMTDSSTLTCKVWQDGSLIVNTTKSTLLPATGTALNWNFSLRTLEATAKNFYLQGVELYTY